jgi:hypothetical protein
MPTQQQIADHIDISQQQVSELMAQLGIDWKTSSLAQIRLQYIRKIRAQAAGHKSETGLDLVHERVLTERVDRELKQLIVAEKKGQLINVEQLEPEIMQMVGAFRSELLARDDKLKFELDSLYAVNIDLNILNEHTNNALSQLARYDVGGEVIAVESSSIARTTRENEHAGMGESTSEDVE